MKKLLLPFSVLLTVTLSAQKVDLAKKYSSFIDSVELKKHLTVLASDAYEGRETGKNGQRMAANYIMESFRNSGCAFAPGMKGFEQPFDVFEVTPGGDLSIGTKTFEFKKDFIYYGPKRKFQLNAAPLHSLESAILANESAGVVVHYLKGMDIRAEVTELKKNIPKGTLGVILVTTKYAELYEYFEHSLTTKSMRLADGDDKKQEFATIIMRADAIRPLLKKPFTYLAGKGKRKKLKQAQVIGTISAVLNKSEERLTSTNILAFIPGSDPILSKEIVVITAHYDHIGIDNGVVYNGADDDGTGTVALLELAQAFMTAQKEGNGPRRSILIMPVSGEEKGLLGSSYYASHPIIPLELTIADLNIDMIGRDDIAHEGKNSNYVYIIGSDMISQDVHNANEKANKLYTNITLDYKFNSKTDPNQFYYRSDHYNFAKNDIPSIFYFSGVHADYHQPTDDVEKINFTKVETVARLVFHTAWILANETKRPSFNM